MNAKKANKVVRRAERAGWSMPEIAAAIGCSVATIYNWRSGKTTTVAVALMRSVEQLDHRLRRSKGYRKGGK